ncbi:MAG TPA: ester cyclase [Polyangiaceae bacterium]|nr:ester cyclase [Polyangiaceae bacterium]
MTDPKAAVVHRYFAELFNLGKLELLPELLHPDYVNHSPGSAELPRGRDGVGIVVQALRRGLPDLRYQIDELVVGEESVAARTTMTGTHLGDLFGMAPTGRALCVSQMTFERFREGRIIAHHRLTDDLTMLRQLGRLGA